MIKFPGVLVVALGLPLLVAACGEDEEKKAATGNGATDVVAKCTENMKTMTASNDQMKALVGKEGQLCGCLVDKVKNDQTLNDADRTAIYAGLSSKPGSDEATTAQGKMTEAGNKATTTAMSACTKELMSN